MFMRAMCALDTGLKSKTRGLGTIESFLLMTEWHPRALHFPIDFNGWEDEMVDTNADEQVEEALGSQGNYSHRSL